MKKKNNPLENASGFLSGWIFKEDFFVFCLFVLTIISKYIFVITFNIHIIFLYYFMKYQKRCYSVVMGSNNCLALICILLLNKNKNTFDGAIEP